MVLGTLWVPGILGPWQEIEAKGHFHRWVMTAHYTGSENVQEPAKPQATKPGKGVVGNRAGLAPPLGPPGSLKRQVYGSRTGSGVGPGVVSWEWHRLGPECQLCFRGGFTPAQGTRSPLEGLWDQQPTDAASLPHQGTPPPPPPEGTGLFAGAQASLVPMFLGSWWQVFFSTCTTPPCPPPPASPGPWGHCSSPVPPTLQKSLPADT